MTHIATETELKLTLRDGGDLPYTNNERAIYQLIASTGLVTTTDVIEAVYGARCGHRNARIIVGGMLNTLKHKLDLNGHPLGLAKSRRFGPHPTRWQLVPRSRTATRRADAARRVAEARVREQRARARRARLSVGTEAQQ
jgi:hypothetical protein